MDVSTIRLSKSLLIKLKQSKELFAYETMPDLLSAMNDFFLENGLRPDEKVNYHLISVIQELKQEFKSRDESLRKWIGKISHVDLSAIHKDLTLIKEYLAFKYHEQIKDTVEELVSIVPSINQHESPLLAEESQGIEQQIGERESYEKVIEDKNVIIQKYHNLIVQLTKNVVTGKNKEVVYLAVSPELVEDIKLNIIG